jgi:hypothetical protein
LKIEGVSVSRIPALRELLAARKVFISQRLDWEETRFMAKSL